MLDPIYKMGTLSPRMEVHPQKVPRHVKANINTLKENKDKDIKAFI
jgi:hypothetical protein